MKSIKQKHLGCLGYYISVRFLVIVFESDKTKIAHKLYVMIVNGEK